MSDRRRSPALGSGPGSRSGAQSQSPSRSGRGSPSLPKQSPYGPGLGYDPAKSGVAVSGRRQDNKRLDLPADAFMDHKQGTFPLRGNKFNTEGRQDMVEVNQYRMTQFDFQKRSSSMT